MNKHTLPIVAIVGPPNAGKSTLLNKIIKERLAVTADLPGTTRDRQYLDTSWNGVDFTLVDTAGLTLDPAVELETNIAKQVDIALDEAGVIILVVDGKQPHFSLKQNLLNKFRKTKKKVILAINKIDSPVNTEVQTADFQALGIKPMFAISSVTGRGIGDMLDEVSEYLKKNRSPVKKEDANEDTIPVSIVGKPNVGKSSIINAILNEERVVVSSIPGTTRTSIDTNITIDKTNYTFIDTAGLKRKAYKQPKADLFSGFQTFKSIRKSDVCLFVIEAQKTITKQDLKIAGEIIDQKKGAIVIVNKIDLYDGRKKDLKDYVSHHFPYLWMYPVHFISAVTKQGLSEAVSSIKPIYNTRRKKIYTETLEKFLEKKIEENPPKKLRDQRTPRIFRLSQINVSPPTFELLVNRPGAISKQFRNFLEKSIIKDLNFWGTPIVLKLKAKL